MTRKIVEWFVYSSKNPQKIALTIKGLIPFLALLGLDSAVVEGAANTVGEIVAQTATLIAAFIALWGLLRKLYYSFKKPEA